jgi:hypothetical protein
LCVAAAAAVVTRGRQGAVGGALLLVPLSWLTLLLMPPLLMPLLLMPLLPLLTLPQTLAFLNQKRPSDVDRDSVFLQADAFATLVQLDFLAIDGVCMRVCV